MLVVSIIGVLTRLLVLPLVLVVPDGFCRGLTGLTLVVLGLIRFYEGTLQVILRKNLTRQPVLLMCQYIWKCYAMKTMLIMAQSIIGFSAFGSLAIRGCLALLARSLKWGRR